MDRFIWTDSFGQIHLFNYDRIEKEWGELDAIVFRNSLPYGYIHTVFNHRILHFYHSTEVCYGCLCCDSSPDRIEREARNKGTVPWLTEILLWAMENAYLGEWKVWT